MKILVLTSRIPYPLEKGDKLRIYHQLRFLSKKHEIILCCLTDSKIHPEAKVKLKEVCSELHLFPLNKLKILGRLTFSLLSSKPFQVNYFFQKKIQNQIHEIIERSKPDHIFCQLIRTAEYVKNTYEIPKSLDYMDALSKGTQRRIKTEKFIRKALFKEEHKRLSKYENLIFDYFDGHCIISEQDRNFIKHPKKKNIEIISNGIDNEFFKPETTHKKYDLVFTGNMNYPPNSDGAIYIVKKIMPIVWKTHPNVNLIIAGVNDNPKVKALASVNVKITGWMDDIRSAYNESKIFVAPMLIGTGLQNKLLEAMSMGLPCITSTLANNALNAKENQEVLIGQNAEDYAEKIIFLLQSEEKSKELGEQGKLFVHQNYNWESSAEKLNLLIQATIK